MRLLKKINKGFALMIIVLLILIIYLINVEVKRNSEKPNIEQACKEYIELIDEYAIMPINYQKIYTARDIGNIEEMDKIRGDAKKEITRTNGKIAK